MMKSEKEIKIVYNSLELRKEINNTINGNTFLFSLRGPNLVPQINKKQIEVNVWPAAGG